MVGNRQGNEGRRPARWKILDRTEEASCRVFSVVRKRCRHPWRGREDDFYVLESSDWVNSVAVTPDGRMVLVEQYRFGSEDLSLEVPGGLMDLGESPVEAAERELREETGFVGRRSRLLGTVRPNPAIQSNHCHIVLIEEVERLVDINWDENEELALQLPFVAEVYAMAHSGKINHALALNALFLYHPIWLASSRGDLT